MILEKILGSLFVNENLEISGRNFAVLEANVNNHETEINDLTTLKGIISIPDSTSKIEIVAGAIRQNTADRTKWDFIRTAGHTPVGVLGDYAVAVGSQITVNFSKTFKNVIGFIACTDEYLANSHNLVVGASVGLDKVILQASASIQGSGTVYYDGASWVVSNGTGQDILTGYTPTFAASTLNLPHGYCPGQGVQITATTRSGAVIPYIPVIRSISDTEFRVSFLDYAGAFVSAADSKMSICFTKTYNDGIKLDGTSSSAHMALEQGNIWFLGIFEV
jgi:hypothetical protein